jgi:hypothetical protein
MKKLGWVCVVFLVCLGGGGLKAEAAPPDHDGDGFNKRSDCNDRDASIYPGALEICGDGIDQDCNGADLACTVDPDQDRDDYTVAQGDCNDQNASINPGANEICGDGIDQDCSGADLACPVDPDSDRDGYTVAQGDCNDQNASINPGANEICGDGIDQNCDSVIDEGCPVEPSTGGHEGLTYTGPGMCVECHSVEASDMFASTHYQWQGDAIYMTSGPMKQGKGAGAVNTYCGNITGNWSGCSACHVGRGLQPDQVISQPQLENIDCLVCHQKEYKRIKVNGVMVPDTANMTISMDRAVQTVHLPERANCLACHAKAGGGDAVKRGDLALATIRTADRNYDVHMATTGANLACQDCHAVQNHRFPGKGSDLRATDLDVQVECSGCHTSRPHDSSNINKHTARVACQTCHIPVYGKNASDTIANEATEVDRSWQAGTENSAPPLHPVLTKANNLIPRYRFWNRFSTNYLLGEVAQIDPATGAYATSRPQGSINDGKLYPFKYKTSDYPLRTASQELIALDTSVFFATADAEAAARSGLVNMGYNANDAYEWVTTDTYQLLNHQVGPQEQALQCNDCHLNTGRMDLQGELGYAPKRPKSTCSSACHSSSKASEWSFGNWEEFTSLHNKHVNEYRATCADCHNFSR